MNDALRAVLTDLMETPGLAGHEDRVRARIAGWLRRTADVEAETDRMGNLWTTFPGEAGTPSVLLFTHMDQLGFVVRKIESDGFLRLERLGGVPERALAAQAVLICVGGGHDLRGVIANKSHHATGPEEKYQVVRYRDLYVDAGFDSEAEAADAGVQIGTPVVYAPRAMAIGRNRVAGTSVDDRAGCAALIALAQRLAARDGGPTVHLAFTTQEEFNLRGALPLAQRLQPDIALQIDLMLASDTPDAGDLGDMRLGAGPGMSLYSFHGRGTLNGVIPHPALVRLAEAAAAARDLTLQRSAQTGVLTDLSYVQLVGAGVAALDLGYPMRYSHSALEVCDLRDLDGLAILLEEMLARITPGFSLSRDGGAA
ncbi:M42 family metallopeptidase [Tropicimonas sp. IMCC6043]|uniref:M42 family metallopeptidase n=1 Tax=Tropicimonas sp. IMCC6043 TaxID=2510645 RepID=UPI00101B6740|nr:M20/M25/M40 family metallo-hydrolase [Tropicimonas sp. IMCC6043]RYH06997.1 M42 family peptidase [Tropicimonas sp. IMCC6043]